MINVAENQFDAVTKHRKNSVPAALGQAKRRDMEPHDSDQSKKSSHKLTDPELWWAKYGEHYEGRDWTRYRGLIAEFVTHGREPPLLDVGCGYGFVLECARRFGIAAVGLEASETARQRCNILHPLVDVRAWTGGEKLPLGTATVGGVVLNEFVDHITMDANRLLFSEIQRTLKPGGLVIVKSPSKYNRFDDDLGHVSFFSPTEFREFMRSFSFEIINQPYVVQPIFGETRLGSWAMRRVVKYWKPEKWAARIDLIARKPL